MRIETLWEQIHLWIQGKEKIRACRRELRSLLTIKQSRGKDRRIINWRSTWCAIRLLPHAPLPQPPSFSFQCFFLKINTLLELLESWVVVLCVFGKTCHTFYESIIIELTISLLKDLIWILVFCNYNYKNYHFYLCNLEYPLNFNFYI